MSTRFVNTHYSDDGMFHRISILDTTWVGAEKEFDLDGAGGYDLEYDGPSKERKDGVVPSSLTFSIHLNEDNESFFQDFFDECLVTQEDRFYILVERSTDDGANWSTFWRGILLQDQISHENESMPYAVSITANCGLARLATFTGEPASNTHSFVDAFLYILNQAGLSDFFGSSDVFLRTNCRWLEDQTWTTTPPNTLDPLLYTRTKRWKNIFYTLDENNNKEYDNLLDVLEKYCNGWRLRIFQAEGFWWLVQVENYDGSLICSDYAKDYVATNVPSSSPALAAGVSHFRRIAIGSNEASGVVPYFGGGGSWDQLAALYGVKIAFSRRNAGIIYSQNRITATTSYDTGELVYQGSATGLGFQVKSLVFGKEFSSSAQLKIRMKYQIKIDTGGGTSYYWVSTSTGPEWQTTAGYFYGSILNFYYAGYFEELHTLTDTFSTDAIPASGQLYIQIIPDVTVVGGSLSGISTLPYFTGHQSDMTCSYVNETAGIDEVVYELKNASATSSSEFVDLGETPFGDFADETSGVRTEVFNLSGQWVEAENWRRRGTGSPYSLHELNAREYLYLQSQPTLKIQDIPIIGGEVSFCDGISFQGNFYAPIGGSYNSYLNEWVTTWVQIGRHPVTVIGGKDEVKGPSFENLQKGDPNEGLNGTKDAGKLGKTTATVSGASVTSLSVEAIQAIGLRAGDVLEMVNWNTGYRDQVTLSSNVSFGATSISIVSKDFSSNPMPLGSTIHFSDAQLVTKTNNEVADLITGNGSLSSSASLVTTGIEVDVPQAGNYLVYFGLTAVYTDATEGSPTTTVELSVANDGTEFYFTENRPAVTLNDKAGKVPMYLVAVLPNATAGATISMRYTATAGFNFLAGYVTLLRTS